MFLCQFHPQILCRVLSLFDITVPEVGLEPSIHPSDGRPLTGSKKKMTCEICVGSVEICSLTRVSSRFFKSVLYASCVNPVNFVSGR